MSSDAQQAAVRQRLLHGTLGDDEELTLGRGIAKLLLEPATWVHRRVEFIRFLDDENVERQMSVDFTLPALTILSVAEMVQLIGPLVPLTTVSKDRLQHFSIWQEDAATLPILSRPEGSRLAGACLVFVATRALRTARDDGAARLPEELAELLRIVAEAPGETARTILRQLRDAPQDLAWRVPHMLGPADREALAARPRAQELLAALGADARTVHTVFDDQTFSGLADELGMQFVMTVPLAGNTGARRVLKFRYEQEIRSLERSAKRPPAATPDASSTSGTRGRRRVRRPLVRLLESIGWRPRPIRLDYLGLGHAGSHHVEIEAPEQLEILDARLTAFDPDRAGEFDPQRDVDRIDRGKVRGDRVHLYHRDRSRSTVGFAQVRLRAEFAGLPVTAPALALLTATVLLAGSARSTSINTEAGAALLLIGPALLATFLARPGEHRMATSLLLGVRLLLVLTALASFTAAGALAAQYERATLRRIWDASTGVACFAAAILTLGLLARIASAWVPFLRRLFASETPATRG